jgi:DNA-binding SARP family transcriptional activator/predicted ATPase
MRQDLHPGRLIQGTEDEPNRRERGCQDRQGQRENRGPSGCPCPAAVEQGAHGEAVVPRQRAGSVTATVTAGESLHAADAGGEHQWVVGKLSVELLGAPRVTVDGQPISVDTRKAIALIAHLATTNQPTSRDVLAALFWPEYDQERARASLRRTLSALRKGLGPFGDWLLTEHDDVGLGHAREADVQVDVRRFTALLAAIETHGHGSEDACEACLEPLSEAAALHKGDFLAGFSLRDCAEFEEWQRFQAESFRRLLAAALERLARLAGRMGKHAEAIAAARRRLSLDLLHEPAHRELMLAYASAGERTAALEQYRRCVRTLDEELGVAPLPETTQLAELIRENRALPTPTAGANVVFAAGHQTGAVPPRVSRGAAPLVGRASQMRELQKAYAGTIDHGCLVILAGEPGIGKTRLAEEFLAETRANGAVVVTGRCYEGESDLAYGVATGALRKALQAPRAAQRLQSVPDNWLAEAAQLLPELAFERPDLPPPFSDSGSAGARLVESLRQVLVALLGDPAPGVFFLDDLQWADEASLELVSQMVRRFGDEPLVVLVTVRDEDGPVSPRLRRLIADAHRSGAARTMALTRLGLEDVVELVASTLKTVGRASGLADMLYAQTEGLPLFLVTCLESLADHPGAPDLMPAGMRDMLRARVASLSEAARQLLSAAAIVGHSFDFDTLCSASGRTEEEAITGLDELLAKRLVKEVDSGVDHGLRGGEIPRFDFSHEQLRQVVYRDTTLVRRRLLHRRVADALRGRSVRPPVTEPDPGEVAMHYRLGGLHDLAAEYYGRAGDRARHLHANTEALAHFEAALALGHPDPAWLQEAVGDLQTLNGAYDAASMSYELAAARLDGRRLVVIERKLGTLFVRQGVWVRAESHFRAALTHDADGVGVERARLLAAWSLAAHRQAQFDRAWALASQALQTAVEADDPRALAECHNAVGMLARHHGDLRLAARHLESSLQLATDTGEPGARIAALNNLALLRGATEQPERGLELLDDALGVCKLLGDRHQEAALLTNAADLLRAAGRTSEAMERVKSAVTILADIGGELGSLQPEIWRFSEW